MNEKSKNKWITPVLVLVIAIAAPLFFTGSYLHGILIMVLINTIVALGLNFITGLTGQMNLGTAGIMAIGAYTSALLTTKLGINPALTLIVSIIMGLLIGVGLGYPSLRVQGVYLALTTIAFNEIVRILISNLGFTNGIRGVHQIPTLQIGPFNKDGTATLERYYVYLVIAALLVILASRIINSKWGRLFKGIRDNPDAVSAVGVNIAGPKIMAFTLATIYGCIGGSLYALHMGFVAPTTFTFDYSTTFVIMMMLGGIGTVEGPIIGAIIATLLPEILRFMGNYYWIVFSAVVFIMIIFRPLGIVSIFQDLRARLTGKTTKKEAE